MILTSLATDTRRWLVYKILSYYQAQAGADPANNPLLTDPYRELQRKLTRARAKV